MSDLTQAKTLIKECQETQSPYLDLGKCGITDLNKLPELFECTHLETLILSNSWIINNRHKHSCNNGKDNTLSSIPKKISNLKKLINLIIGDIHGPGWKISDISFLSGFTQLQFLDLRNNQIKEIPEFIFNLNLKINLEQRGRGLCLYSNPIESPPIEILKQSRQSVLNWFKAEKKKLNEIKIILIGEPKAEKTSLLKRLKENSFDKNEVQTDGVNIENIAFGECETFKNQKSLHDITGHFWDFGGQEIMNSTHQFFLTKRSVYVLVLHARNDAKNSEQIRNWVMRVKATGGDSPIIVVANQIDVNPGFGFENENNLQSEFPQIKHFIKASCSTGDGLELLKEKLEELIPTAELFQTEIDERWISIKEKLQEETKPKYYLNESRFLEICNEFGLRDKFEQKNAINFLHDLGLILHFEDINLSEYYVLDPYWITYGVYQILTSAYAGKEKGIVSMDKLEFIINEEEDKNEVYNPIYYKKIEYSPSQRRFLIDILNQFKLCFCIANNFFIIPDLLDTTEPSDITDLIKSSDDTIQFAYEYEYLPKSIMPNIMVETHHIMKEKWRTGCVLDKDGSKALITNYRNRISIIVAGEHKKKREFMSVIRHIIDAINQKLTNKPKMLIPLPEINDVFVDYEELLEREKDGENYYTVFKPSKKRFEISMLLDGIPTFNEVREISDKIDKVLEKEDKILIDTSEIKAKLDLHFEYFKANLPNYGDIKDEIEDAIRHLNNQQTNEIVNEIMTWVTTAFGMFDNEMDEKLKNIHDDINKTDDIQAKLKLSIPFINLLGINFETEFDIKSWAKKMHEKYKIEIFKFMGAL
jgi:GTPase SAR1 and related small G proteins